MDKLAELLNKLDGKSYKALKSISGKYEGSFYTLFVDHVQSDPFAPPSRIRFFIPLKSTDFHEESFSNYYRKIAFEHFFSLEVQENLHRIHAIRGTGKSGVTVDAPGQEVLDRTAVRIGIEGIEFRLSAGLPARGRTILGKQAAQLLTSYIPKVIEKTIKEYNTKRLEQYILLSDEQQDIRLFLQNNNLVSFIGNGATLPRETGVSQKPLKQGLVIPFQSPEAYELIIPLSSGKKIKGMGIPKGVTIVVGGGYHGKSTLLQAIEKGVYNHSFGDGREYVITNDTAMKIRAEDGRTIQNVNISPFINDLPFDKDTKNFTSDDASGSTSQAASIIEALEMKTRLLLIDEDTSATNFMIRDARMQKLVKKEKEPITPFIDRVRQLYVENDVSTILVIGGSGDYFEAADHVIMMDEYKAIDRTNEAKKIAEELKTERKQETTDNFECVTPRILQKEKIAALINNYKGKVDTKGLHTILVGKSTLSLYGLEQLIDTSQTRSIAYIIKVLSGSKGAEELKGAIDKLYEKIDKEGLETISPFFGQHPGDLALPRKNEVAAAFNRIRY